MISFGHDTLRSIAARGVLFGIALGLSVLARPLEAVRIEEVPTGVTAPWGVAFTPAFTRYVVGGALLTNAVAEEPGWEDVRPSFGASGLRDLAASPDGK